MLWASSLLAAPLAAQDEPSDDPLAGQDQEERLRQLEEKNRSLEERVAELEEAQVEAQELRLDDEYTGLTFSYGEVDGTLQIFGDTGFFYTDPVIDDRGHTSFSLSSISFVLTSQIGEHFRILSETVIDADSDGDIDTDQERLWAAWTASDLLMVKLGTEHSPISRWNQLYHHGAWLQTSVTRPIPELFEGSQGILPMHRTGAELSGTLFTDSGRFEYFTTVSNGRGDQPSDKQRAFDANDSKAVDVGIAFAPFGPSNFRFGVSGTIDRIPADSSLGPLRTRSMHELIGTANLEFDQGPFSVLTEFAWIAHEARTNDENFDSNAAYLQVAYHDGNWTPYTRFGYREMDRGDPFYEPQNRDLDAWLQHFGLRWDASPHVALKLEIGFGRVQERNGAGDVSTKDATEVAFQLAWWM